MTRWSMERASGLPVFFSLSLFRMHGDAESTAGKRSRVKMTAPAAAAAAAYILIREYWNETRN